MLLILIALLRSLVAPLILVAAVVAVWGAALGIGGLVFGPLFGFEGTDPGLGLLSFVFLVALGVDYGIFLMHRMREESLAGAEPAAAALTALRTTGGVIASAGLVLAATFAVLTNMPLVQLVELGFVIAVGVLLDTFLVRTYLVTSASVPCGGRCGGRAALSRARRRAGRRPGAADGAGARGASDTAAVTDRRAPPSRRGAAVTRRMSRRAGNARTPRGPRSVGRRAAHGRHQPRPADRAAPHPQRRGPRRGRRRARRRLALLVDDGRRPDPLGWACCSPRTCRSCGGAAVRCSSCSRVVACVAPYHALDYNHAAPIPAPCLALYTVAATGRPLRTALIGVGVLGRRH